MKNEELQALINDMSNMDFNNLAEKSEKSFDIFYSKFRDMFGKDKDGNEVHYEIKKEMVDATYAVAIQHLNQAIYSLEQSYLLSLSILKTIDDNSLTFTDDKDSIMQITNDFIHKMVLSVDLTLNNSIINLMSEKRKHD